MPFQIVKEDERLTIKSGDSRSKIYYRRIPTSKQNDIIKLHTKKGKVDWSQVTSDFLKYIVLGWDGVEMGGEVVPFDPALLPSLPSDTTKILLDLAGAEDVGEAEKNSVTMSPGK